MIACYRRYGLPPTPGMMPKPASGKLKLAFGEATRISAPSASSKPPPRAAPSTAAITGQGSFAIASMMPRTLSENRTMSLGVCEYLSFRSAPAQNVPVHFIDGVGCHSQKFPSRQPHAAAQMFKTRFHAMEMMENHGFPSSNAPAKTFF